MFYYQTCYLSQTCYITGSAFLLDDAVETSPATLPTDDEIFWDVPQDAVVQLALGHSSEAMNTNSIFVDRHLTGHLPIAA